MTGQNSHRCQSRHQVRFDDVVAPGTRPSAQPYLLSQATNVPLLLGRKMTRTSSSPSSEATVSSAAAPSRESGSKSNRLKPPLRLSYNVISFRIEDVWYASLAIDSALAALEPISAVSRRICSVSAFSFTVSAWVFRSEKRLTTNAETAPISPATAVTIPLDMQPPHEASPRSPSSRPSTVPRCPPATRVKGTP